MSSQILADILTYLDSFDLFDRTKARPAIILDGHGSRLQLPFLERVVDENKR
jgi:hypothetical protein